MAYKIPKLPLETDLETKPVMKKVTAARSALAELKGAGTGIPNETILISTLSLQEAKDSSAIENIITTQDELYQSDDFLKRFKSIAAKEIELLKAKTANLREQNKWLIQVLLTGKIRLKIRTSNY